MPQRNQEKDSNSGVNLVWNLGGRGSGSKKFRFLQANFRKISIFSGNFTKEYRVLQANFRKFWSFSGNYKNSIFQAKNCPFSATSGQIILFLFKSSHFRTYFLYMIRYNNISRPVHDSNDPPAILPATLCPKSEGRDPQLPGLTPLDSNENEAFSRRNELPRGGLRSMKIRGLRVQHLFYPTLTRTP